MLSNQRSHCTHRVQTVNTGSLRWAVLNILAYFYMVGTLRRSCLFVCQAGLPHCRTGRVTDCLTRHRLRTLTRADPPTHPTNQLPNRPDPQVLSWGGYSFVINLIPIFCLACVASGRMTGRHYLAFAPLVFIGTLLSGEISDTDI